MSALDAALDVFTDVDMQDIRHKTKQLTSLFVTLASQTPALDSLTLASPTDAEQRGAQLAWRHPQAYAICQALIAAGVIGDFRAPDILRLGFSPLYLRYEDIWHSVQQLASILETGRWQEPQFSQTSRVT
jgi:kynureninase